jgi:hypothetical protein
MRFTEGAVLETGCVYIVPLQESLKLPKGVAAAANPKSSTGRLDIFTRVITDYAQEFDKVPEAMRVRSMPKSPAHLSHPRPHRLAPVADPLPRRGLAGQRRADPRCTPRTADCGGEVNIDNGLALSVDLSS